MGAKDDFVKRIRVLHGTINSVDAVRNKDFSCIEHNETAKMLRNGLAVVGFSFLEDFIKRRSDEVVSLLGTFGVPFEDLPEKVQIASTYGAVNAISYQISLRNGEDKVAFVQEHAKKIASTSETAFDLTSMAFGYGQSNIGADSVKDILKAFQVHDPWGQITSIASSLGLAALPLNESFKNAARRRHRAAHVADCDTPQGDISQYISEAFSIAVGFDFLISAAVREIRSHNQDYLRSGSTISSTDITIRAIRHSGGKWKEFVSGRSRAHRVSSDFQRLASEAKRRAVVSGDFYIQFDEQGVVSDWAC